MNGNQPELLAKAHRRLAACGISPRYLGGQGLASSALLVMENKALLDDLTGQLYPQVANIHQTNWKNVEAGIRYVIRVAWDTGSSRELEALVGRKLYRRPRPKEVIHSLVFFLEEG